MERLFDVVSLLSDSDDDSFDALPSSAYRVSAPDSEEEVPSEEEPEVLDLTQAPTVVLQPGPDPEDLLRENREIDLSRQVQGVKFFLTYPRCHASASSVLLKLEERFGRNLEFAVAGEEVHADGEPHLHCCVKFRKRISYTDRSGRYWDFVTGTHGNYQQARNVVNVVRYVIKDGKYVSTSGFDPRAFVSAASKKRSHQGELIGRSVLSGDRSMMELASEFPAYFVQNLRKVEYFASFVSLQKKAKASLVPWPVMPLENDLSLVELEIHGWLQERLAAPRGSRGFTHLRIRGPTGLGKSSLVHELRRFARVYVFPYSEDFYCDFSDDYDFVLMDEYRAQLTPTFLNSFCDGMGLKLKRKGKGSFSHTRQIPVIMLSNFTWEQGYSKLAETDPDALAPSKRRFTEISLDKDDNLFFLINLLREAF